MTSLAPLSPPELLPEGEAIPLASSPNPPLPVSSLPPAANPPSESDKSDLENSETVIIEDDDGLEGRCSAVEKVKMDSFADDPAFEHEPAEELGFVASFKKSLEPPKVESVALAKPEDFPDGGYGWVIVTSCFLVFVFGFGLMYSMGVYIKAYYYGNVFPGTTLFQLSWIGSVGMATQTMIGPFTGRLADRFGSRVTCWIGGAFIGTGFICASFATYYWILFITQGFMYGLGAGFTYFGIVTLPSQWFFKKRGLAIGISVAGGGIGGLVITPLTQYLIDLYGWQWALRITGMTAWAVISICAFFLIPRFPPMKVKAKLFDASFFKDYKFAMLYMAFFTSQWGFFVPWTYIPSFAVNAGMTPSQGSLALGLANGASAVGRIVLGGLADRTGHVNSYCVCMLMTPICLLLIWPFAGSSFGLLTLFGILYGFLSGGFISLFPSVVAALFGMQNLGSRMGAVFTSTLPGNLAGSPLAGAILQTTAVVQPDGSTLFNYLPVILYSGFTQLAAGILVLVLRMRVTNWKLLKKI